MEKARLTYTLGKIDYWLPVAEESLARMRKKLGDAE